MKKKITLEIDTSKEDGMIEAYIKYSLKMLNIESIKVEKLI